MTLTDHTTGLDLRALRALAAGTTRRADHSEEPPADGLVPAVSYLRVSTKDQATRNGLEEGLSIPAQRDAAARKAEQLGAVIVKEFIEPGESAKTARRRALQEMLDYLAANAVQYCIINKVDRLARNRLDDAIIHATLRGANITLVSVTENIDETPSGMLMHGILASMAEFYSLNLAQEVTKGMVQKATLGGTPTKAPLGYLNVRTTDAKGREVRDVQVDPERAELIRFAFTAYAGGEHSLSSLARELKTRGLTTRPTPSQPARPVTTTALHKILTNPYYQGTVTFRGITYDGAHTPLVDSETWLRVQTQLDAKNAVGERPQKYDHYLKGNLYCSCGAKLMIERPRDKNGERYEYFTCSGRRKKTGCTRSAVLAPRVEDRIDRDYGTNGLTTAEAEQIASVLHHVFAQLEASSDDERKLLQTQRDKLDAERLKLVQAHYADAIPLDLLKAEQDRIRTSLDAITNRLDGLATTYRDAHDGLDQLLGVLTDLGDLYARCEPTERRMLNRALFKRIVVDEDENITFFPTEPAATVLAHARSGGTTEPSPDAKLPRHQTGQVSNFSTYVDLRGLEPLTPCMPCRCATSCATGPDRFPLRRDNSISLQHVPGLFEPSPPRAWRATRRESLASRGSGKDDGDDGAVLPQAFEPVVRPLLLMEDMRHEVAEIEEDPAGLLASFAPEPLVACLEELLLDLIGDGGDIALAAPGDDEEDVDERQRIGHVQGDEVLAAGRVRCGGGDLEHLPRLFRRRHQIAPVTNARMSTPTRASARTPAVIASVSISRPPFSGVGGLMTSPGCLWVLIAALAAIGVGDECAGSSPSTRTASTSLPSAVPRACPVDPKPSGRSYDPVRMTSPVEATGEASVDGV